MATVKWTDLMVDVFGYSRMALYTAESLPIVYLRKLIDPQAGRGGPPPEEHRDVLLASVQEMLEQDKRNVQEGVYPLSLLYPESPGKHFRRYLKISLDSLSSSWRAKNNVYKSFSRETEKWMKDLPEYYLRNFHHQTDGYLSRKSAEIYSHQTEILFKGTIALMRRLHLSALIQEIQSSGKKTVRVLELGCGAGEASETLLSSCPQISLRALDLSQPYLERAEKKCARFKNVRFEFGNASEFSDSGEYDVIFSCFLFHELPLQERQRILQRNKELLAPGGTLMHIDSLQLGDDKRFDWALKQFPKDFHEPFYRNYIETPLSSLFDETFEEPTEKKYFLSKSIRAKKRSEV